MARRTFDVIDVTEIFVHWHAGRSLNEMSQSLGVDRKTLRKYIAPAEAAGITPGGPPRSEQEWAELVRVWFPQLADTRLRQVTWPAISEHHDYIVAQLKAGVRMSTIHQRLLDERGLAASSFFDRPACQCIKISVTSITSNVLLAIGLPSSVPDGRKVAPSRWPGPPRHARHPHGELRERGGELRERQPLKPGNYVSADTGPTASGCVPSLNLRKG